LCHLHNSCKDYETEVHVFSSGSCRLDN
jgi:hypothetical protein